MGDASYLQKIRHREGVYSATSISSFQGTTEPVFLAGRGVEMERDSFAAMLVAHATHTPAPPSSAAPQPVPPALDELVLACLAKEPEERPSAGELDTRLATLAVPDAWTPTQARAWWRANMASG